VEINCEINLHVDNAFNCIHTHGCLGVNDVDEAAEDDDEVKDIPRIAEVILKYNGE